MNEQERIARDLAAPQVKEARAKYAADENPMKLNFVAWFNETHVIECVRQPLPTEDRILKNKRAFGRWFVKNISASIHPDNFKRDDQYNKMILMQELSKVSNKLVNMLKGVE